MNTRKVGVVAALILMAGAQIAYAVGSSYGKGDPQHPQYNPQWPAGVKELVNREDRVSGFWLNQFDSYNFAGDTIALNGFLEQYAKLKNTPLKVFLHPGRGVTSSLEQQKGQPYDWQVGVVNNRWQEDEKLVPATPYAVTVNVYLGGQVDLRDLKVPDNVKVESGGEIERFVAERHAK